MEYIEEDVEEYENSFIIFSDKSGELKMKTQEEEWQLYRCQQKYPKIPKRTVKKIFKHCWDKCNHLETCLDLFELCINVYLNTKSGELK